MPRPERIPPEPIRPNASGSERSEPNKVSEPIRPNASGSERSERYVTQRAASDIP
jgi:hypothetical protein